MQLKIGILGTRGIPNDYGGFEHIAAQLSRGLVEKGHSVTVYNSSRHPYQQSRWHGVDLVHCYDPQRWLGTAGQFIYDLQCLRHARRQRYDVLLILGYTSSSVWSGIYPRQSAIITNMDGMEWKRSKYSKPVRSFLKYAEALAVRGSDFHIADSPIIKSYLDRKYQIDARYIPYGAAVHFSRGEETGLMQLGLVPNRYCLQMARLEPENNTETIIEGYLASEPRFPLVIVGNTQNRLGRKLIRKYKSTSQIVFAGAIFDEQVVSSLLLHCRLYFHGHTVGGTNPSLLQAMAAGAPVAAHDNAFNRSVLNGNAEYFKNSDDLRRILLLGEFADPARIAGNTAKVRREFSWTRVVDEYERYFLWCHSQKQRLSYANLGGLCAPLLSLPAGRQVRGK